MAGKKRNIELLKIPYKQDEDETEVIQKMKMAFRRIHIRITSDVEEDAAFIRKRFFEWRQTGIRR